MQSDQLGRSALEAGRMGAWEWIVATNEVTWSASLERIFGLEPRTFGGTFEDYLSFVHPDDREIAATGIQRIFDDPDAELNSRYRLLHRDGSIHWIQSRGQARRNSRGEVVSVNGVCWDITKEAEGAEARDRLVSIIDSSDDGILWKTLDGTVQSWNQGAERIFGYTAEEMIGTPIVRLLPSERIHEEDLILRRIQNGQKVDHFETIRIRKDGKAINVSVSISPVRDISGKIIGASKIVRDITFQKMAEQALREADKKKDEFLATLAHELRNPLGPILNGLQILKHHPGKNQSEEIHGIMERQIDHLVRLVDDLLDVSRIGQGKIDVQMRPILLKEILESAIEANLQLLTSKGHKVELHLEEDQQIVQGDQVRLTQIFGNLINNAAKYSNDGGMIRVSTAVKDQMVEVRVMDTGIGIPPEKLSSVFGMFFQIDDASPLANGGLGLGLALAYKLVELHGGKIEASSLGVGHGCTFTVSLPVGHAEIGKAPDSEALTAAKNSEKLKILLVDDNHDNLLMLEALVRLNGHDVMTASTGQEAIQVASTFKPQLAFVDIGLPDIPGRYVASSLRETFGNSIMLVAISGYGTENDRIQSIEAGFNHHVTKPAPLEVLEALMQEAGERWTAEPVLR